MDINEKKITAAFEKFNPTEKQKERIYENILNVKNAEISGAKKILSGRFRGKRMGSVIAAAAAVLATGTLAVSALGLIDLQAAFGDIFSSGADKLESISAVPQNVVTEGDGRLSMKVVAIGGTETEVVGAVEIVRNDGGTFPDKLIMASGGHRGIWASGALYCTDDLTKVDDVTALYKFRLSSDEKLVGKEAEIIFRDISDRDMFHKVCDKFTSYDLPREEFDKEVEDTVILSGTWSITFPLEYNTDYRTAETNTAVKIRNRTWKKVDAVVTKVGISAISADIMINDVEGIVDGHPDITVILADGSEVVITSIGTSGYGNQGYEPGEYNVHCSFDYPVDVNDIEKITVNGTPIELK